MAVNLCFCVKLSPNKKSIFGLRMGYQMLCLVIFAGLLASASAEPEATCTNVRSFFQSKGVLTAADILDQPNSDHQDSAEEIDRVPAMSPQLSGDCAPQLSGDCAPELSLTPAATLSDQSAHVETDIVQPLGPADNTTPGELHANLDEELLQLLGEAPEPEITLGKEVHKDIAGRWHEVIKKGLKKDSKERIFNENRVPENCNLLIPPLLNPEVKAALSESLVKRDTAMAGRQKHLSVTIAALTTVIDKIITKNVIEHKEILKIASDACRILCDMYRYESETRRRFIISSINNELKDALNNISSDKYLFGEDLSERLKSAKTVQKSGQSLKQRLPSSSASFHNKQRENYNAPHQWRPGAGPTQQGQRQAARHPRAPPRAPPRAATGARRPAPTLAPTVTARTQTRRPTRR